MNNVILIGRVANDIEVRGGDIPISRFRLAVDRKKGEADFISCIAFGKTAEFIQKYFSKGMKMAAEGRIQTGSYTKQDGTKVYTTDVVVESVEFVEPKKEDGWTPFGE